MSRSSLLNDPVQVGVDEVLPRHGAPVAHDGLLQVGGGQWALQQGIVQQIQLAGGEVVGRPATRRRPVSAAPASTAAF